MSISEIGKQHLMFGLPPKAEKKKCRSEKAVPKIVVAPAPESGPGSSQEPAREAHPGPSQKSKSDPPEFITKIHTCGSAQFWQDGYGVWRCGKCEPPICFGQVVDYMTVEIKEAGTSNGELRTIGEKADVFEWQEISAGPEDLQPCEKCGSLELWWDWQGLQRCMRCDPMSQASAKWAKRAMRLRAKAKRLGAL